MAVEFVGVADSGYSWRTGSVSCSVPGGVSDGDFLILAVLLGNASGPIYPDTPAGWTPFAGMPSAGEDGSGFDVTTSLYWRVAASEPASYTVDYVASSQPSEALILAYSGAGESEPDISVATGFGDTTTMAGMTAEVDGTRFVYVAHDWRATGGFSPPGGTTPTWTERHDSAGSLFYAADGVLDSGESTGDDTQTTNNGDPTEPWTAILVALEPPVLSVDGDLIATESGDDTAAIAGVVIVQGDLSASETGADTAAIDGVVITTATGTIAATETGADTASIAGQIIVTGLINATETGADTVVIRETAPSYSEVFAYEVPASDLTYTVGASDLRYEVGTGDMRYEVAASDLRFTIPAR